jgi:hypothetical protein
MRRNYQRFLALILATLGVLYLGTLMRGGEIEGGTSAGNSSFLVTASTFIQAADGMTESAMTTEEVGRWAAFLIKQGVEAGRELCLQKGGGAICATLAGSETHQILELKDRRVGIISIRIHGDSAEISSAVRIIGFRDGDIVSVACMRTGPGPPVTPRMKVCSAEIQRSLGFVFPGSEQ